MEGWERYGRLVVERSALVAALDPAPGAGLLSPAEIGSLTGRPGSPSASPEAVASAFEEAIEKAHAALVVDLDGTSPFARITRYAGLTDTSAAVLAIVATAELDDQAAALLRQPLTLSAVRRMLGDAGAAALADDGQLRSAALIELEPTGSLGGARVQLTRRTAWALLGDLSLDPDLPPAADAIMSDDPDGSMRVLVVGADRVRRTQAAAAATAGLGFLVTALPATDRAWVAVVSQATTAGVGLVLDVPAPDPERPAPLGTTGRRWLERAAHLPIALCSADPLALESLSHQSWTEVRAAASPVTEDEWTRAYGDAPPTARRPTADQVDAMRVLDVPDPIQALRRLASGSLLRHARRVEARATWDDLVLPPAQERRLRSLVDRYRNRDVVHSGWGLPLYPSPGIVALFSGSSGTGKTTSAEVIAHELGVDLFRVDLSALVSKYIGETEKNLEEIFSAAHSGDYLLLFDEADSLFGSRSEVSDSRDRYANMEVSYLLQRLETYDGFVVLTSNFQGNIDDAFLRRIHATISFPMPGPEDRARIWTRSLAGAPIGDLDLDHVANGFELSGGSIRNAALTAAHLAAARDGSIGMVEVLAAVSEELGKLRQRLSPQLLGKWADEVTELG
ncbi:MAG TPA: ATP-binding protein [Nocardioides sp.]|uniref:ATP-binding protein n=1 Tax=Nocardioides sp. TaxID=35761 RepID=UPI002BC84840|nr:ATP-binding protein [Nocardioides sp.]HTW17759.1 ATP-binding protein [Nocardioides sp.]